MTLKFSHSDAEGLRTLSGLDGVRLKICGYIIQNHLFDLSVFTLLIAAVIMAVT